MRLGTIALSVLQDVTEVFHADARVSSAIQDIRQLMTQSAARMTLANQYKTRAEAVERDLALERALAEGVTAEMDRLAARVADLEAQVASHLRNYNGLYDDYHEMRHRSADIGAALHAARQRIAELEAALAAQGWQPVTETPPLPDEYYLTDDTLPSGNEPWIVNYYSAAHGWANRCRVWLCPPPLPPAAAEATE